MSAEEWIALATVGNTLILIVAALFAWGQVRATRETTLAQTRPFVVVDIDLTDPPMMRVYIENIGRTIARNVSVAFDPPLRSSLDTTDRQIANIDLFTKPLETLAPGKRLDTFFDVGPERDKVRDELGDSYAVSVTYQGDDLHGKPVDYSERQTLNIGVLWGLEFSKTYTLKDVADRLDKIVTALGKLA